MVQGMGNMLGSSRAKLLPRHMCLGEAVFLSLRLVWLVLSLGAYGQRLSMNS